MTEYTKAKAWRESLRLSIQELAEHTGYSPEAIRWFERGITPTHGKGNDKDRRIKEWVWKRYKIACCGVAWQRRTKKEFNW